MWAQDPPPLPPSTLRGRGLRRTCSDLRRAGLGPVLTAVPEARHPHVLTSSKQTIERIFQALALLLLATLLGCSARDAERGVPEDAGSSTDAEGRAPTGEVTYHEHIEPLIQARCLGCHRPEGGAPFNLLTYEDARNRGLSLANETRARRMPPWPAQPTAECTPPFPFIDDPRLSDDEIALFARWVAGGLLEGDPAKAPPRRAFDPAEGQLSRVDLTLQPAREHTVAGTRDTFRCFVLDPGFAQLAHIKGIRFVPGNPKVVHHAIAFLDPDRESLTKVDANRGYDCFAGPGLGNTSLASVWAPGAGGQEYPSEAALEIPANTLVVLQVHYHPVPGAVETDQSRLELERFDGRPSYVVQPLLIGNYRGPMSNGDGLLPGPNDRTSTPEFRIPAGVSGHAETLRFTLPRTLFGGFPVPALKILTVGTHMHYVGVGMRWWIEHEAPRAGEPGRECMVETPAWRFEWQRAYSFDTEIRSAPEFRPGDRLMMRCEYENTMANPYVARTLREQGLSAPRDVYLGESTLDEMCLAVLSVAYPNPF